MKNDNNKDIVSDIADGKSIDWDKSSSEGSDDKGLLEQYQAIDKIAQVFNTISTSDDVQSTTSDKNILFQWGHLDILEKIGEGSYGEVYRAYDPVLDRTVALKLLKEEKSSGFQSRAFMQEAKRLAKVRNRHVLAVHGANIHDSRVGIWSDLIDGVNLSESNKPSENHTSKQLIHVISSLSDALQAVHQADLVHGDIKPSNVMLDTKGKLILMDFGAGTENSNEQTQSGYVVATPLLMSPELFKEGNISQESDIYALGVLLFKLATGKYPIQAKSLSDIQIAHEKQDYLTLHQLRPDLPKPLRVLIQKMMSYDIAQRPTANDIQKRIDWIITTPKRRANQLALSIIFVLLTLAIVVTMVAYYRVNQEKQKTDTVSDFMIKMLKSTGNSGKGRDLRVADILDSAAKNVNEKFANQPHARATIHNLLGNSYINLQLSEDALSQLTQALAIRKEIMPHSDPEYLNTLYLIAFSHQKLNNYSDSKKLYKQLIKLAQNDENTNFQLVQLTHIRLAQILTDQGELVEAEEKLIKITQTIVIESDTNGDNGYLSLFALANNFILQSKYKKAEQAARESLAWLIKYSKHSEDNVNNVKTLLASALANQGRFKEAVVLYRQALIESERLYGQDNRGYLIVLINLAGVLQQSGQLQEAMELQMQSLEISKKVQGKSNLDTIMIGINLANTKVSMDDFQGGERLMRETLSDAYSSLGNDHIETLKLEYNLAELLNNTQRFSEAEELAINNNKKMRKQLGESHLFTLLSIDNIAVSLTGQKKYAQAEILFNQTLTAIDKTMGKDNPYYELVMSHLEALIKIKTN